jgi:RimJ/RimL family protein N-acetyltransferase
MKFDLQPPLENERVVLYPLVPTDFEILFQVASDQKVWEQHPNKDRWKEEEFWKFFEGALVSKSAYKIVEKSTGAIIGSTRFYDYDEADDSLCIGYTFYGTNYWGTGVNRSVKFIMLNYAFRYVAKVYFHVGACNTRSQIAVSRLGARKVAEKELPYYGELPMLNYIYELHKEEFYEAPN